METIEECFSTNGEDFNFTDLDDAAQDAFNDDSIKVGDIVTIQKGIPKRPEASNFISSYFVERLGENAWDNYGEYVGDWPECTGEQSDELMNTVKKIINDWADKHGLQPGFYTVENIETIKLKLLNIKDCSYEVVNE